MPRPLLLSVVIGAVHAAMYVVFAAIWFPAAMTQPKFGKAMALMAGAALVMALCLGLAVFGIIRRKRAARAPLLTLFLVEFFSFLFTLGNVPGWLSLIGLASVVGGWGLLTRSTREYLGVEERPTKFD